MMFKRLLNIFHIKSRPLDHINMDIVNSISSKEFKKYSVNIDQILKVDNPFGDPNQEERCLPGNTAFIQSHYYKIMLKRYLFAGAFFCRHKNVLDSCSGLGWGAYILSLYANLVTAFDINHESIDFSKNTWGEKKIKWFVGDALNFSFLKKKKFDCVLAMETIEHFSKADIGKYIVNMHSALKKGGVLVGTTPMTTEQEKATELLSANPYHLHIYAPLELKSLLEKYFSMVRIVESWMFVARK